MTQPLLNFLACAILVCGVASAEDEDPVEKKLAAAKVEFEKSVRKAHDGLLSDLKRKLDSAQKNGDLSLLEKVQAETKAFESNSELPKTVPVKSYESQIRAARMKLEEAYAATVKQYTRDGKIAGAKAVEKERMDFRKGLPAKADDRKKWVHAKGEFAETKVGVWEEKSPNGKTYQYKEVARTKEYVELDALNGDTALRFRLYNDRCDYGKRSTGKFTTMFSKGQWMK